MRGREGDGESTLDLDFEDKPPQSRDHSILSAIGERFRHEEAKRDKMLLEQIAMGWGDTPAHKIPADWRTRRGPERLLTEEHKKKISQTKRILVADSRGRVHTGTRQKP